MHSLGALFRQLPFLSSFLSHPARARYAIRLVLHLSMVLASVAPTCAVVLWAGSVLFVVFKSLARSTQCPLSMRQADEGPLTSSCTAAS